MLEGSFPTLWVQGEISNLVKPASGHLYFSLKDKSSQIRCAMFKGRNRYVKFNPENGMEVLVRANVSLYEGRGEFQLIIESMEPAGEGALQRAFEELKHRLNKEGLFAEAGKIALPTYPTSIGIITSPTGAAVRDILHVLKRRYPTANVIIYPVPVQGEGAAETIAKTLALADHRAEVDVLILARGGGSLEDLWSFNEEVVAQAIHAVEIPIVCGVGHEIDFTIADFVADQRAATPSVAAELVSPNHRELLEFIDQLENKLSTRLRYSLQSLGQTLIQLEKRLPQPTRFVQMINQRVDDLYLRMQQGLRTVITEKQSSLIQLSGKVNQHSPAHVLRLYNERTKHIYETLQQQIRQKLKTIRTHMQQLTHNLNTVNPLATLNRGYAIVTQADDTIVREAQGLKTGESITTRVAKGHIHSTVTKIENK